MKILPKCRAVSAFLAAGAVDCLTVTLAGVFFLINRSGRVCATRPACHCCRLAPPWPNEMAASPNAGRERVKSSDRDKRGDHIVAGVAARILQTSPILRPSTGTKGDAWKAPFWRALSDAGLRSPGFLNNWVARRRRSCRRLCRARRRQRFAVAVPLAETADGRLAAGVRRTEAPDERHDNRSCRDRSTASPSVKMAHSTDACPVFPLLPMCNTSLRCQARPGAVVALVAAKLPDHEENTPAGDASNVVIASIVKRHSSAPAGFDRAA